MLHELSNADKHRLMHTVGAVLAESSYEIVHLDPGVVINRVRFFSRPVRDGSLVGYVYIEKHGYPAAKMTLTIRHTYNLVFERRTNDMGQPLPANDQRINVTTSRIRNAVWQAFWQPRRFSGRKDVATIETASLMYPEGEPSDGG